MSVKDEVSNGQDDSLREKDIKIQLQILSLLVGPISSENMKQTFLDYDNPFLILLSLQLHC